jgi:hypothetical protein
MSESLYKDKDVDDEETSSSKHDAFDIFGSIFSKVHIWTAILLFILYIVINTSFFVDDILKKISPDFVATDGNPTSNGIIVQGVFLSIGYIILDLLVNSGVL